MHMVGTHQFRLLPVETGATNASENIVHIPHSQPVGIGKTPDGLYGNRGTGINLIGTPAAALAETLV